MNATTSAPANMQPVETLSEQAYAFLCDVLFRLWAGEARRNRDAARKLRALLACAHAVWSTDQACPETYAEGMLERAQRILENAYRYGTAPRLAAPPKLVVLAT